MNFITNFIRNIVLNILITLLLLIIFIDPNNNIFYIKDIVFIVLFGLWLFTLIYSKFDFKNKPLLIILSFIFLLPIYGLIIMKINNLQFIFTAPYLKSFYLFFLLVIILNLNINITQRINYIGFIISIIVLVSFILFYFANDLYEVLYNYMVKEKQVAVSRGYEFKGYKMFNLFYKTSPILLFPLSYYFQKLFFSNRINKKKKLYILAIILISISFVFSSTRANIIIFFILLFLYSMSYIYYNNKKIFWISFLFCLLCVSYLITNSFHQFSLSEKSNSIKIQHFYDYIKLFESNTNILILGQGFNSYFFSTYYNDYINVTELSYFEIVRVFGLPVSILFILFLLYPIYILLKKYVQFYCFRYILVSYTLYLTIATSNPLILSSTGMIVIVYVYSIIFLNTSDFKKSIQKQSNE